MACEDAFSVVVARIVVTLIHDFTLRANVSWRTFTRVAVDVVLTRGSVLTRVIAAVVYVSGTLVACVTRVTVAGFEADGGVVLAISVVIAVVVRVASRWGTFPQSKYSQEQDSKEEDNPILLHH